MEFNYCFAKEDDLEEIYQLREKVFVDEQKLSNDVIKSLYDFRSKHLIIIEKEKIIGAANIVEIRPKQYKLERICVDRKYRSNGIGSFIVKKSIELVSKMGGEYIELTAQSHLIKFYSRLGFKKYDNKIITIYGKPHIKMYLNMKGKKS